MSDERVSVRERYERDEKGNLSKDKKIKNKKGGKGRFNPFKKKDNGGGGGNAFIVIIVLVLLGVAFFTVKNSPLLDIRTWNSTAEEDFAKVRNSLEKIDHQRKSGEYEDDFYDKNRIYNDEVIRKQVEKEYIVYVYTPHDKENTPFDVWVEENQKDYKIYKLHINDLKTDFEAKEYKEDRKPMMLLYNEIDQGEKELHGVIKDKDLLDNIPTRIEEIKEEKKLQKEQEKQERIEKRKKERENSK